MQRGLNRGGRGAVSDCDLVDARVHQSNRARAAVFVPRVNRNGHVTSASWATHAPRHWTLS